MPFSKFPSAGRSPDQPEPCLPDPGDSVLPLAQRLGQAHSGQVPQLEGRGGLPGGQEDERGNPAGEEKGKIQKEIFI